MFKEARIGLTFKVLALWVPWQPEMLRPHACIASADRVYYSLLAQVWNPSFSTFIFSPARLQTVRNYDRNVVLYIVLTRLRSEFATPSAQRLCEKLVLAHYNNYGNCISTYLAVRRG